MRKLGIWQVAKATLTRVAEADVELASKTGLRIRPWKTSLMFTPPSNGTRMLFTVWAKPEKGGLKAYVGIEPFTEFFPVERAEVEKRLGAEGWRTLNHAEFDKLLRGLEALDLGSRRTAQARDGR